MRRGLTLIEVLFSLALLTAISAATASWIGVLGGAVERSPELEWKSAAESALDLILTDLIRRDGPDAEPGEPRIVAAPGVLFIRTRCSGVGACRHTYELERGFGRIRRREVSISRFPGPPEGRTILFDVRDWSVSIDEDARELTITIESGFGATVRVTRRFRVEAAP